MSSTRFRTFGRDRMAAPWRRGVSPQGGLAAPWLVAACAVLVLAPAVAADTPSDCSPCQYIGQLILPARAFLDQLRQYREKKYQEASDAVGKAMRSDEPYPGVHLYEKGWQELYKELTGIVEKLDQEAIPAQEEYVASLEAELEKCKKAHCAGSTGEEVSLAIGTSPYETVSSLETGAPEVEPGCAKCDAARERLKALKQESMSLAEELFSNSASLQHARDSGPFWASWQLESGRIQRINRLQRDSERIVRQLNENARQAEEVFAALQDCRQKCADESSSRHPRFWIALGAGRWTWTHPEEAVQSFLDSVNFPGASETGTSDTADTTASATLGVRWPMGSHWSLGGAVAFHDGPEFSSRGEVDLTAQNGAKLRSIVDFDFTTGTLIEPQLLVRYQSEGGFFIELAGTYLFVSMDLKTTETFVIDGQVVDTLTTRMNLDDSAIGYGGSLGWAGERLEFELGYRAFEAINSVSPGIFEFGARLTF